ncbi:MAG: hypothetical protein WC890_01035 [Candidatus Margulisiibacteriota bacterium]
MDKSGCITSESVIPIISETDAKADKIDYLMQSGKLLMSLPEIEFVSSMGNQ